MSTNKIFSISLSISLIALCLSAFAFEQTRNDRIGISDRKKVLIAAQDSPFKNAVISKIRESLQEKGCSVDAIPIERIATKFSKDYQAIVIINTCIAWQINSHARKFLASVSIDERKKIIIFTTAKNKNWHPKLLGIDAITSASTMNEASHIADVITGKVLILLNPE